MPMWKFQWHHRESNLATFRLVAQCLTQLRQGLPQQLLLLGGGENLTENLRGSSIPARIVLTSHSVHRLHAVLSVTQRLMMWTGHPRNVNMRSLHVNGWLHEGKVTAVVQDMTPCSLAGIYKGVNLLLHSSITTEALGSFETSLTFYQTTRRHIPEGSNFYSNAARTQISFNLTWFIPFCLYTYINGESWSSGQILHKRTQFPAIILPFRPGIRIRICQMYPYLTAL
jgi:hypothetical protein